MLEFLALAAVAAALTAALIIRPLVTQRAESASRAAHDVAVFRDQLTAVERDLDRGVLSAAEADGARAEVSRRLLAAATEAERSDGAGPAPALASRLAAAGLTAVVLAIGAGLYMSIGAPGRPDLPLQPRLETLREAAAKRPGQEAAEATVAAQRGAIPLDTSPDAVRMRALVEQLRAVLDARPDDLRGRRLLVDALMRLDDLSAGWRAQKQVIALLGVQATGADHVMAGEAMILAAGGYVSLEAEGHLTEALRLDPGNATGRYYAGLSLAQNGRVDLALEMWTQLLREGAPDAPWKEPILRMIGGVANEARQQLPPEVETALTALRVAREEAMAGAAPGSGLPGPDADAMRAARDMAPADRRAMVEGMVAQLEARLTGEGGSAEDWMRLIGAHGVLGSVEGVGRSAVAAKTAFASDAQAMARIDSAAAQAARTAEAGGAMAPAAPDAAGETPAGRTEAGRSGAATAPTPALAPAPALPGPDADALRAAQDMAPGARAEMIQGMVARLSERLQTSGGAADEWARLIRAYGVMGRTADAEAARQGAIAAHGDAAGRAAIAAAAADAGLPSLGGDATLPPAGGDATLPPVRGDATLPPVGGDATLPPAGGGVR